ncbi:MAG: 2Fe-2S iron-sulfur cluster-binding protein [Alphaproteobacteria bacterium]
MDQMASYVAIGAAGLLGLYVLTLLVGALRQQTQLSRHYEEQSTLFRARAQSLQKIRSEEIQKTQNTWSGLRKFEVAEKINEIADCHSIYLKPHDGRPLPPFEPGQFLTFKFNVPDQPSDVIRCYSLSDAPGRDYYRITVKKVPPPRGKPEIAPGVSSTFVNEILNQGDIIDVRAPNGGFYLKREHKRPVVLIGGGVGITPVLSMLNYIVEHEPDRETWFFLGVPNKAGHLMKEHLDQVAADNPNVRMNVCYSDPEDGDVLGVDYQHKARVSVALFKEVLPSNNFEYYFCGPPPMMNALDADLREWGVPDADINSEAFGPASVKKPTPPPVADGAPAAAAIAVTFARSGKTVDWTPAVGTLLDLAEANGVDMASGCRAGSCGTCLTAVIEGEVGYADPPDAPVENGSCLACVGSPKGPLKIDA